MEKLISTILITLFVLTCYSQDLITKKNGEDIQAKVLEVGLAEIKYKKFDNLGGPTFVINKSDVLIIRYENGTKDIFTDEIKIESTFSSSLPSDDPFTLGQRDADKYYKGYKQAGTGTLITGIVLSPLVGLVPAVVCSTTQPQEINLNYPDPELMKIPEYYNGYTQKAHKIKRGKVWTNWGIAFGINLAAVVILYNQYY
jgi:hypothetical protein